LVAALIYYSFERQKNRKLVFGCPGPSHNLFVKLKSVSYEVKALKEEDKTLYLLYRFRLDI